MKLALTLLALFVIVISTTIGCTLKKEPENSTPTNVPIAKPTSTITTTPTITPISQPTPSPDLTPTDTPTAEPSPAPSETIHVVKSGETLSAIAAKYNTTIDAILAVNPDIEDPNFIYEGQKIIIPAQ